MFVCLCRIKYARDGKKKNIMPENNSTVIFPNPGLLAAFCLLLRLFLPTFQSLLIIYSSFFKAHLVSRLISYF